MHPALAVSPRIKSLLGPPASNGNPDTDDTNHTAGGIHRHDGLAFWSLLMRDNKQFFFILLVFQFNPSVFTWYLQQPIYILVKVKYGIISQGVFWVKFSELVRLIEQNGFELVREKGSIRYYANLGRLN